MRHQILIIDDSEDLHPLIIAGLADQELDLHSAFDGASGVAEAKRLMPDLILLDVDMPGTDGFDVCRALKSQKETESIPVIFLTGASSSAEKLRGLEIGAVDYVIKPFDPAELFARVRIALQVHDLLRLLAEQNAVLHKSEEQFRMLAENGSDMISRLAADGTCLYTSPACKTILGRDPTELDGRKIYDLIHPDDLSVATRAMALGGSTTTWASRFRHRDGSYVWLETTAHFILDQSCTSVREIHAASRDITLRKRTEILEQDRAAVLEAIAQNQEIEQILSKLVQMTESQFRGAVALVAVVSDGRTLRVAPSLTDEESRALEFQVLAQIPQGRADKPGGSAVSVADVGTDAQWAGFREACPNSTLQSCWWISVRAISGGVLGLFMICHREAVRPNAAGAAFLDLTGKLLMIALEHRQITNQLAYRAQHDALTGVPNRILFEDRLAQAIARSDRTGESVALLYIDLDRFKLVNDTLGHQAGDELLRQVVQRFLKQLRTTDTLARMGGDEFALIVPEMKEESAAAVVADKLIACLQNPFDIAGREVFITGSIGIGVYPKDATDPITLEKSADAAMYQAKASGKNCSQPFLPEMIVPSAERLELANSLRRALDEQQLILHYQPMVDRASRVVGFEVLVRWNHPRLGVLAPLRFIPLAEESGLIVPIGNWVLREAVRRNKQWQDAGLSPVRINVNVSAVQFLQPDFVFSVKQALQESGLNPQWLELELTESVLMENFVDAAERLNELRAVGVRIAIDDFGTGYSSLAYLQRLPVDTLKIDRCFVNEIPVGVGCIVDTNKTAVIRAVMSLAQNLGMHTVVEGVENEQQRAVLLAIGCCEVMQGFYFSKPCPFDAATALLKGITLVGSNAVRLSA